MVKVRSFANSDIVAASTMPNLISCGNVRHVLWDWNGTLLDDHEHCIRIMNAMLREEGLSELDVPRYRSLFDFPVRRYYERLGFSSDDASFRTLAARFIDEYDRTVHECRLHANAAALLQSLSEVGILHTILSAARQASVEALLRRHDLDRFFSEVVGLGDHYAAGKSELGVQWMGRSGVPRDAVVLVGDTVHDYEVAEAMGVRCILVAAGHHARERLERCGCPVVDELGELFEADAQRL